MKLGPLFQLGLTVSVVVTVIEAQFIDTDIPRKCPENWILHENSCYRFIKSPIRPRADALRNCQAYEAELMSVNSMDEHRFIMQELTWQDPQHRRWYISGRQQSPGYWVNEADGSSLSDLNALFLPENQGMVGIPNRDFLAYSYANRWGLEKVSGDEHLTYICEAPYNKLMNLVADERSFSYGSDIEDPEFTPRGPYFIRQPADVVYDLQSAKDTKDVSMTCRAGGYPAPTYEWFREEYEADKVISRKIFPLTDKRYTLSGGSLIINNPTEKTDRGLYYCKATNMFGSVISEAVQLNFGYIGEFNLNRPDESGAQNWGKALNCDPPTYYPDVKFLWSRGRFPDFVEEDKRVFVSHDGALYFSALEHIDIAKYSCNVHSLNEGANTGRNGPVFHLSVIDSGHAQQLTSANTFPKVFPGAPIVGRDARLECFAFGYPVPSYNWTRVGAPLPKNHRVESFGRVLIIPKIHMEDQGEYICKMTNSQGVKESNIVVSVQAEPNFTIPLTDRHMDIHSDLTWTCEAFGMPDVTYQWFKDGAPLIVNGSYDMMSDRYSVQDNILNIKYLDPEKDPGMYQCRAMNALKTRYSSAQLRVLALRPSFKRKPLDTEIYAGEGRKVSILCNPEAAPKPKFEWRKDGNLLGSGGPRLMMQGNLTINPVSRSDAGIYVCHASNQYGADTSSTRLTVLRLPQFIESLPAKINVIVGQNIDLRCYVTSEDRLDVAYIWTHNGLKLHTIVQVYSAVIVNSGTLTISNVTYANAGEYECIAKTVVGSVETRTTIYVEGPPSSPGGLQVSEVIRRNVKLQWTDGSPNGRSILYYIVSGRTSWDNTWLNLSTISNGDRTRNVDLFSDRKEAIIEDAVTPWAQYEFRLQAINEIGSSPLSEPSPKANIPADRPYVAPSQVSGGGGKIGDLTITWTPLPPWQQNGPGIRYNIFWRRRSDEKEFQRLALYNNMTKGGVAIVPISTEYYYTEYDVKVQAANDIGTGPESEIASIYSAEDIPHVQPQSMTAVPFNSTALNASWTPVAQTRENIRGKLIGYRLKYWREDSIEDTAVYYLSRHTRPWALIVGLQSNTTYYVKVMAFNGAGAGPESERILERTYHKAPQQPPTSVFLKGLNPSTIRVWWRYVSPNRDEEPLTGYKVRVWPMREDISRAQDTIVLIGSKLEAHVHGLSPGKQYSLRVLAFSNGGDGRMSSPELYFQMGREESFINSASRTTHSLLFSISLSLIYSFTKFL